MKISSVESITQIHKELGLAPPQHPLITLLDVSSISLIDKNENATLRTELYIIAYKADNTCNITYGHNAYDYHEGSLVFTEPGQVTTIQNEGKKSPSKGWILCFHPDLISGSNLASKMKDYTYFTYSTNEALHLSNREKEIINSLVTILQTEYSQNLDIYSNKLIISNLETLLNYCERFYGRQFITRQAINLKGVAKFEELLKERMSNENLDNKGIPSVKELAKSMGYSANYLSDMLKKETGRRTQDHIHEYIIKEAKNLLLGTDDTITQIAYTLGYDYPEHFAKLFKKKVGVSPSKFREGLS